MNDVSDNEKGGINGLGLVGVTVDGNLLLLRETDKVCNSSFWNPVVSWADNNDDGQGDQNGGSLDHAIWEAVLNITYQTRYNRCTKENFVNRLIEVFKNEF